MQNRARESDRLRRKCFCVELTAISFYAQANKTRQLRSHSRFPNRLTILNEYRVLSGGQQKAFRRNSIKLFSDCQVHSDLFWCPALQYGQYCNGVSHSSSSLIRGLTFEYIRSPPGFKLSLLFCNILLNCIFS